MACTTILVGKKASYNGSTMIARNDDGRFDEKKLIVVNPKDQPRKYTTKISKLTIELPSDPLRYTSTPSVDDSQGIWAANGINEYNVCMTATETITSNAIIQGIDPMVRFEKAKSKKEKDIPGGLGEEDLVVVTLPYIKSAREGVLRLGSLLNEYGTYEMNGIAFSDKDEIWWMETIGGHNWIAKRVEDNEYVIMPNQFGLDNFDFTDAYGDKKSNMCSDGLKDIVTKYFTNYSLENFNPRLVFGSHDDSDHVYNTPRAWYMARYFNPRTYKWDGDNADFTPLSDDIPWSLVPEKLITVEEVKYILSSYYQGTPYDPTKKGDNPLKGIYRPIGINRTGVMAVLEIRNNVPAEISAVEWLCYGCNAYNAIIPLYTNVTKMPEYVSKTTLDCDSNSFYWATRLIGAMADMNYGSSILLVERYQKAMANKGHENLNKFDNLMIESNSFNKQEEANNKACENAKVLTQDCLNKVLRDCSEHMKVGYNRADN